jgi:GNAT superfamily N-acetyltransferase
MRELEVMGKPGGNELVVWEGRIECKGEYGCPMQLRDIPKPHESCVPLRAVLDMPTTNTPFPQRYYIWKSSQALAQQELWVDPKGYYFLNIITVLPSEQGKGVGKALFEEVTKRADAEGIPCYLESSRDEPNTKIYKAMGFKFAREMDCDDNGTICKLFCMVRKPKMLG